MKKRLGIISLFIVVFIAFIAIWNYSYYQGKEEAYIPVNSNKSTPSIPSESGVFERSEYAIDYAKMPIDENHQRSIQNYYDNRAFYGAPPSIPHEVNSDRNMGDNSCLKCHENGGYVEKYKAYTPVTPHPEKINCRQCHVPQKTQTLFKATNFERGTTPMVGANNALDGSPPVIPHDLQLRENCLACHAGPSAPKEIRVTHPERINCRQCHVPNNKVTVDVGDFIRKTVK
ncbi:nitrate reductase cytochrome c-type subunit [Tenacibaculum xiamenense]|uniref:nitrate reductase cytochrome c-type subunit n=1 Tax=Tenacibaculum xiamenense TaxID=1261553 RepID=UPI003894C0F7